MDIELLKSLISQELTQRGIADQIGKSQCYVKHWLKKHGLKTNHQQFRKKSTNTTKYCNACAKSLPLENFYKTGGYCKICITKNVIQRQRAFKLKCLEYKDNKCYNCGYRKSIAALEFHHSDPAQKDFEISKYRLCTFDDKVKAELDKCLLLCSNCHREEHERLWNCGAIGSAADF